MNSMTREELRPCYHFEDNISKSNKRKAFFHKWTEEGYAIIEFEDGTCTTCDTWSIQFIN